MHALKPLWYDGASLSVNRYGPMMFPAPTAMLNIASTTLFFVDPAVFAAIQDTIKGLMPKRKARR